MLVMPFLSALECPRTKEFRQVGPATYHHMESVAHITCQWHQCDSSAEKHAVFNRRVFEYNAAHSADENPRPGSRHSDLCLRHLSILQRQYVDVMALELGSCPEHGARAQAG